MNFYLFILLAWIFFINFRRRFDKRHLVVFPWQVMFRCILSPSQKRVLGKRKKIHKYLNLFLAFFIISSTIINAKQIKSTVSLFKPTMKQIRLKTNNKKGGVSRTTYHLLCRWLALTPTVVPDPPTLGPDTAGAVTLDVPLRHRFY